MKKITVLTFLTIMFSICQVNSQNGGIEFGIKGGGNFSKFTPDFELSGIKVADYRRKFGFYVGGFLAADIAENLKFQPELLFAIQGTGTLIEDIEIRDDLGNVTVSDFKSNINELTISIPLVVRYILSDSFFIESGPQLGFILDRYEKTQKTPFEPLVDPEESIEPDYDKFDAGLTLGAGYNIAKSFSLNGRFFFGLIERDNVIKSSVFNLGLEYKL